MASFLNSKRQTICYLHIFCNVSHMNNLNVGYYFHIFIHVVGSYVPFAILGEDTSMDVGAEAVHI